MKEIKFNQKVRDSVFTYLFRDKTRVWELYRSLHPEDQTTQVDDIEVDSLRYVWIRSYYNDLSFRAGNKLCILIESQTTWNPNMPARMLVYYVGLLTKYLEAQKLELASSVRLRLPQPEFYVLYSGSLHPAVQELRFSSLAPGNDPMLEVRVPIIRQAAPGSITENYLQFCRIFHEQLQRLGNVRPAILATIKICLEKNVLADFIRQRQAEMEEIMEYTMTQEEILQELIAEGTAKGVIKGRKEGRKDQEAQMLKSMMRINGWTLDKALAIVGIPQSRKPEIEALLQTK